MANQTAQILERHGMGERVSIGVPGNYCEQCATWWPAIVRTTEPTCPECGQPLHQTTRHAGWVTIREADE
jgi:predicted amidophosphoribosyltransferase